jgi:predicted thioesterase
LEVKDNKNLYAVLRQQRSGVKIGDGTHRRAVINTKSFGNGA